MPALGYFRVRVGTFLFIPIPTAVTNPLVTAGTKAVSPVGIARTVPGEDYGCHIGGAAGIFQTRQQFIYSVGTKSVAHLRAVKGDAQNRKFSAIFPAISQFGSFQVG